VATVPNHSIEEAAAQVRDHPVFEMLTTMARLQRFMELHVWAVWDFMSLVKRLQREFSDLRVPWLPPRRPMAARLINEIVMAEESDEDGAGQHASHFEIYLKAMREVGARTEPMETFIELVSSGMPIAQALDTVDADPSVRRFVQFTLRTAQDGGVAEVLGSFLHGRENVIPAMFSRLLDRWAIDPARAPALVYYLKRHIEVDGDSHGPAAVRIVADYVRHDAVKRHSYEQGALGAIAERLVFWDAVAQRLDTV
jgi:Protein of unknown function (DUF3050)